MSSIAVPAPANRLVAADGRTLPLRSMGLHVTTVGGLARTRLTQRFVNVHAEPLTVLYQLPLPADGAVGAFAFRIGAQTVTGEIARRDEARERFERAVIDGRTTTLIEQDRSSMFTQELANVPPGVEVLVELTIDQPLRWLVSGEWEYRFPTTIAPRYLGEPGRVPDASRIVVDVADGDVPARVQLTFVAEARVGAEITSPSHALRWQPDCCSFAEPEGVPPDRDVVLRWRVADEQIASGLRTARRPGDDCGHGLLTVVPPLRAVRSVPRDLVILIDVSGSMSGPPLRQATEVVNALIDGLSDRDRLAMTAFASAPTAWQPAPRSADAATRAEAKNWLAGLRAAGSTEMRTALVAALRQLRSEAQTQVLLVTDGHIGFEHELLRDITTHMLTCCRLHVLGVGSAPNRSLTAPAARAGRGCEAIVGIGEDPAAAAARLQASLQAPLVVDLEITGPALLGCAPARLPDLLAGAPLRLALQLRAAGGTLLLRGRSPDGPFEQRIDVEPIASGGGEAAIVAHYGRERIEDLELAIAGAVSGGRDVSADERAIEAIGLQFGLASRFTSWVAVSDEPNVDPRLPSRRVRVPHALPHGMSIAALGLNDTAVLRASVRSLDGSGMRRQELRETVEERAHLLAPSQSPSPRTAHTARIVRLSLGALWLELTGFTGSWQLPDTVMVRLRDGTEIAVTLLPNGNSTASGPVTAEQVLRLALKLPGSAPFIPPIAVELHGEWLLLEREAR
jgi:Ca-activated chloride channel family protein